MYMPIGITLMKKHHMASRHVKLFTNGHNQAVRIPKDFELPGNEALMHQEGNRLIIEPISSTSLSDLFASWKPIDEGLPPISDAPPESIDL